MNIKQTIDNYNEIKEMLFYYSMLEVLREQKERGIKRTRNFIFDSARVETALSDGEEVIKATIRINTTDGAEEGKQQLLGILNTIIPIEKITNDMKNPKIIAHKNELLGKKIQ